MRNYITTAQAAEVLGVSKNMVQKLIRAGDLKARLFGRVYLIDPAALAAVPERKRGWVKGRKRGSKNK